MRFNEAAASMLRKADRGRDGFGQDNRFNEAAASMLRKVLCAGVQLGRQRRFNEAAASMLRKVSGRRVLRLPTQSASMRPQHRCCGRLLVYAPQKPWSDASMRPQHRCCGRRRSVPVDRRCGRDASMRPQHRCCGRLLDRLRPALAAVGLQ